MDRDSGIRFFRSAREASWTAIGAGTAGRSRSSVLRAFRPATGLTIVGLAVVLGILFVSGLALTGVASGSNIHFVGTPTCTVVGDGTQVSCSGKLAGLGQAPTSVQVVAPFSCTNRGGNQPPGQASGQTGPIQPRGGQITFTNVTTAPASCPDQMTPSFGPFATINVFQDGTLVFSAQVPIT